eukprot:scaffold19255_cov30-Tisochrysis_lutea.AAC.1
MSTSSHQQSSFEAILGSITPHSRRGSTRGRALAALNSLDERQCLRLTCAGRHLTCGHDRRRGRSSPCSGRRLDLRAQNSAHADGGPIGCNNAPRGRINSGCFRSSLSSRAVSTDRLSLGGPRLELRCDSREGRCEALVCLSVPAVVV